VFYGRDKPNIYRHISGTANNMNAPRTNEITDLLRTLFDAAVAAAQPDVCLPPFLPEPPKGRTVVVGAGKASAAMARTLERHWPTNVQGTVVTRYGHAVNCTDIEIIEAAHPVPDENSERAARKILQAVQNLTKDDLVICLISGGGSSLMCLPAEGISLADKQQVNLALLKSGASISEMNCVRKQVSAIKGGKLARAAYPASVVTLLISDVPGDDPATIASGPTVANTSTLSEAKEILIRYGIEVPQSIQNHLNNAAEQTLQNSHISPLFSRNALIATPQISLEAAAVAGKKAGYRVHIISDRLEGDSGQVARDHVALVNAIVAGKGPVTRPCILLSGGETTVHVTGKGRGGRNAEFGMALAAELEGAAGIYALACDTDGIDGTEDNAGVLVYPDTLKRAIRLGNAVSDYRKNNDGYGYFQALDDLVVTGPTRTNVNDFRAIIIV
jgi:glycerate 2-kinase